MRLTLLINRESIFHLIIKLLNTVHILDYDCRYSHDDMAFVIKIPDKAWGEKNPPNEDDLEEPLPIGATKEAVKQLLSYMKSAGIHPNDLIRTS